MNHLLGTKQINVVVLEDIIDFSSSNEGTIYSKVHIHCYHTDDMFSKFYFRAGMYDNITLPHGDTNLVSYYSLNLALESRRKTLAELNELFVSVIDNKVDKGFLRNTFEFIKNILITVGTYNQCSRM